MDAESAKYFAKAMIILTMTVVPIGAAIVGKSVFDAIGRNPKLENSLFSKLIITIALVETAAIFALVAFFTI
jgi:F0F1-type ATP synthase membrane subunit c/vacuolar-type H+-ATPase subunit K